jgi:DNA-binding transcriptional regulator LsrR (DeoR family)
MVRSGCLSLDEVARLRRQGAVGDILGNYVDVDGRVIASPHSERLIALSIEDLRCIETVIAVASEAEKPMAIFGVLRAGVVDVLVVDEGNARAVLELARQANGRAPIPFSDRSAGRRR